MSILYRELRLLYTAEQEAGLAHLGGSSLSVGEQSSGCIYLEGDSYGGHFLHTLSTFVLRPKEAFAVPMDLRHQGPRHDCVRANNTHPLRTLIPPYNHHPSKQIFVSSKTETLY